MTKKIKTKEGDLFAIPLNGGGFSIGLIARKNDKILLGYFFNKIFGNIPFNCNSLALEERKVILITKFSSLGIEKGIWPILQCDIVFDRHDWPIPIFKMQDPLTEAYFAIVLKENLLNEEGRYRITEEDAKSRYNHGLHGYISLANKLSSLLKPR